MPRTRRRSSAASAALLESSFMTVDTAHSAHPSDRLSFSSLSPKFKMGFLSSGKKRSNKQNKRLSKRKKIDVPRSNKRKNSISQKEVLKKRKYDLPNENSNQNLGNIVKTSSDSLNPVRRKKFRAPDITDIPVTLSTRKRRNNKIVRDIDSLLCKKHKTESVNDMFDFAVKLYKQNKVQEAESQFKDLLIKFRNSNIESNFKSNTLSNLALCQVINGKYTKALDSILSSLQHGTEDQHVQSNLLAAKIFLYKGELSFALPFLQKISKGAQTPFFSNLPKSVLLLDSVSIGNVFDYKVQAQKLLDDGDRYERLIKNIDEELLKEDAVKAFSLAKECENISPKSIRVWLIKLVANFLQIALFKSTSSLFQKFTSNIDFSDEKMKDDDKQNYQEAKDKTKALKRELIELMNAVYEPFGTKTHNTERLVKFSTTLYKYGKMFMNQAFLNEALILLKAADRLAEDCSNADSNLKSLIQEKMSTINEMDNLLSLGVKAAVAKNNEAAIAYFTRALSLCPENNKFNARIYFRRGNCFAGKKDFRSALDDFEKCLELLPSYFKSVYMKCEMLSNLERFPEAISTLEKLYKETRDPKASFEMRKIRVRYEKYVFKKKQEANRSKQKGHFTPPPRRHRYNTRSSAKRSKPQQTYYELLGVKNQASMKTIKKAYKKLALKFHPDKQGRFGCTIDAEEKFKALNQAYSVLSSPQQKKNYDRKL